jgi:hypothetical protein
MKLSKEKRNHLILVGIVTIALVAAVWQLLIQTSMQATTRQKALGVKAEKQLKDAESFLASASVLEAEATTLSNALARFEGEMAGATDPYTWCVQLIRQAQEGHEDVLIQEVSAPQPPSALQMVGEFPYQAITFGVRGRAHWEDLGQFVADFENRHPMFCTRNLQLVPDMRRESADEEAATSANAASEEMLSFSLDVVALVKPGT